jgi:hypothetical protein
MTNWYRVGLSTFEVTGKLSRYVLPLVQMGAGTPLDVGRVLP